MLRALKAELQDATAGDPMSGSKWTHHSLRRLHRALRRHFEIKVSRNTIARIMRGLGFSLRTNRKSISEVGHSDRARQFRYLLRWRRWFISRGLPVISVDTKKKEWVGPFKNPGRCWRRKPRRVFTHDFPKFAKGQAIPYGIYDIAHNDGFVVVGMSHDAPSFAEASIRRWWLVVGRKRYAGARQLLIEADSGGANDRRKWQWKAALQQFADEFGLTVVVTHYPPGASKWNPIDHRMFSLISGNWAGEPLISYETILKYIRNTRSTQGFHCRACLDAHDYPQEKLPVEERSQILAAFHPRLPQWNYVIRPHRSRKRQSYF